MQLTLLAGSAPSLRDVLVRCLVLRRPGLVAVVYDLEPRTGGPVLVRRLHDASGLIQRVELTLTGCCLACSVEQDSASALGFVDRAQRWREVVLALPAAVEPGHLAWVLSERHGVLVDTVTTVVDAVLLRQLVEGDDLLAERGMAAAEGDRRSTAELVVRQLEEADVLAVVDLQRVGTSKARAVGALLSHLAPLAIQVPIAPGGVGCEAVVSTGRHDSAGRPRDREHLAMLAAGLCPPTCGVTTVVWSSDGPMHSARLHAALADLVVGVARSRGHVWLADRPRVRFRWESAGGSLSLGEPSEWEAVPGCALVLTGVGLEAASLVTRLDACLATDDELAAGVTWPDPFGEALGPSGRPADR
ncbi:MAG: GTP-binding protein [Pseudorhodobacter sp.]|nr:GTP-binding protein [Frankiaceae bacterium]